MSEKDFVVKNGVQVNNGETWVINSIGIFYAGNPSINSTFFTGQSNTSLVANNADNLGGIPSANYISTTGNFTVAGNLNFIGTNNYFVSIKVGGEVTVNTTTMTIGNTTQNVVVNSTGLFVNGTSLEIGGFYKGNFGTVGAEENKGNIFHINGNTVSNNITISDGENASAVGPITIETGSTLTIEAGARVIII